MKQIYIFYKEQKKNMIRTFDPKTYIEQYYATPKGHQKQTMENQHYGWFHQIINQVPECQLCLEIGSGPVLLLAAYASRKCSSIILSEYNQSAFEPIKQWINNDKSSYMGGHFDLIANMEQNSSSKVKQRLRKCIILCTKCDLTTENVLTLNYVKKVDLITTSLTIEAVAENLKEYTKIIKNITKFLKTHGHLMIFGVLQQTFYKVGQQRLPCLSLTQKDIQQALTQNNYKILTMKVHRPQMEATQVSDFKGIICILAQLQ